jgi:hypothetical protein
MDTRRFAMLFWLATAVLSPDAVSAGEDSHPCGLESSHVLDVVQWDAASTDHETITVNVIVKMNAATARGAKAIVAVSGGITFSLPGSGRNGQIRLGSPTRPITADAGYSYSQTLKADSNTLPIVSSPRDQVQAVACVSTWTYDNGDTWTAN